MLDVGHQVVDKERAQEVENSLDSIEEDEEDVLALERGEDGLDERVLLQTSLPSRHPAALQPLDVHLDFVFVCELTQLLERQCLMLLGVLNKWRDPSEEEPATAP